jgi:enhancing lycopene biosynthesis protein 2
VKGPDCVVNPEVARLIKEVHAAKKPIGFMCIAPVIAARVLGAANAKLTIGNDPGASGAIEAMGGTHVRAPVEEIVVDEANRIVTTPAYMLGPTISKVAQGIEKLVAEILSMTKK